DPHAPKGPPVEGEGTLEHEQACGGPAPDAEGRPGIVGLRTFRAVDRVVDGVDLPGLALGRRGHGEVAPAADLPPDRELVVDPTEAASGVVEGPVPGDEPEGRAGRRALLEKEATPLIGLEGAAQPLAQRARVVALVVVVKLDLAAAVEGQPSENGEG